jgi:hypothetical protein
MGKNEEDIEKKIEELNNIYSDYSKNLRRLENKRDEVISNLEKELVENELEKIRKTI